jgi:hypothetical protein
VLKQGAERGILKAELVEIFFEVYNHKIRWLYGCAGLPAAGKFKSRFGYDY